MAGGGKGTGAVDEGVEKGIQFGTSQVNQGLDFYTKQIDKAIGTTEKLYEQSRKDIQLGDAISQARNAPQRFASYDALDRYMDTLGLPRFGQGSKVLADAMEKGAKKQQMEVDARKLATEYTSDFADSQGFAGGFIGDPNAVSPDAMLGMMKASSTGFMRRDKDGHLIWGDQRNNDAAGAGGFPSASSGTEYDTNRSGGISYDAAGNPVANGNSITSGGPTQPVIRPGDLQGNLAYLAGIKNDGQYGSMAGNYEQGLRNFIQSGFSKATPIEFLQDLAYRQLPQYIYGGTSFNGSAINDPNALRAFQNYQKRINNQLIDYNNLMQNFTPEGQKIADAAAMGKYGKARIIDVDY
jgi:hypothetical protein